MSHEMETIAVGRDGGDGQLESPPATILVVEDEPIVRMLVVDHLNDDGFRILEAQDGPEALDILKRESGLSLMLTDVGLPGMGGRELADLARSLHPDLRILFATGYSESHAEALGLPAPGMGLVGKPFDMIDLTARIRAMLG